MADSRLPLGQPIAIKGVVAMQGLARRLADQLHPGDSVGLIGELGAGKTTFVQEAAAALGVREPVTSPTFLLSTRYRASGVRGIKCVVHLDLYRLQPMEAAREAAVQHVLAEPGDGCVVLIEWADRLGTTFRPSFQIRFEHGVAPQERVITIAQPTGSR